jgi:hypothetical protein
VCEHARVIDRAHSSPGRTIHNWRHYLAVVQRKPGSMRNGAPLTESPDAFGKLRLRLLEHAGGDRELDILARVEQACRARSRWRQM